MAASVRGEPSSPPSPVLLALGRAVRAQRRARGVSQEQLAELSGLHRNYIGGIERGERNVGYVNLTKVAGALGVRVSELVAAAEAEG